MNFEQETTLNIFLNELFKRYEKAVPAVGQITRALIDQKVIHSQADIVNDHIAFRTLGIPGLGIASFEKIFLHHGYSKKDYYHFKEKKLNAYWYAPPSPEYPRIFISELIIDQLSDEAKKIIRRYTDTIKSDPVDELDLDDAGQIINFLHEPLWGLPIRQDYSELLKESEYAAWVIYNRYYLNHYTISVHCLKDGYNHLPEFNAFLENLDIKLNTSGGKIKTSADGLLSQSSTMADMQPATFACGEVMPISGSYVEFAERKVLPQFSHLEPVMRRPEHLREGFETNNADKIFESTYTANQS